MKFHLDIIQPGISHLSFLLLLIRGHRNLGQISEFRFQISLKRWTDFRGACLSSSLPPCRPVYSPVVPFPEFSGRLLGKTAKQAPLLFCIAPNTTINTAAHSVYRTLKFIDFIDFSLPNSYWSGAAVTKNRSICSLMDFSGRFCRHLIQPAPTRGGKHLSLKPECTNTLFSGMLKIILKIAYLRTYWK